MFVSTAQSAHASESLTRRCYNADSVSGEIAMRPLGRRKIKRFRRFRLAGYHRTELLDSSLPAYTPLSIVPPSARAKRRPPWIMIGALLALGTAVGIAFGR